MTHGQKIWITGASSGLGAAVARRLAAGGDRIVASARSGDKLDAIAAEHGNIEPLPLDVTDRDAVARAVAELADGDGLPDVAILNAGTYVPMGAGNLDAGGFREQVEVNLFGVVHMLEALLPRYLDLGRGHIVLVASVAGYRGLPAAAAYGATKAALINLAEALRLECGPRGVKVQLVNPGFVKTPLTDRNQFRMPFLMPVEKAAERLARGLRSNRFEITFPKRFTWQMKLLRLLPYRLYFAIVGRVTGA